MDTVALNNVQKQAHHAIHPAIRQVNQDVSQHHKLNTATTAVITLINTLGRAPNQDIQDRTLIQEGLETIALLLTPITLRICHVLWGQLDRVEAVIDMR